MQLPGQVAVDGAALEHEQLERLVDAARHRLEGPGRDLVAREPYDPQDGSTAKNASHHPGGPAHDSRRPSGDASRSPVGGLAPARRCARLPCRPLLTTPGVIVRSGRRRDQGVRRRPESKSAGVERSAVRS